MCPGGRDSSSNRSNNSNFDDFYLIAESKYMCAEFQ